MVTRTLEKLSSRALQLAKDARAFGKYTIMTPSSTRCLSVRW